MIAAFITTQMCSIGAEIWEILMIVANKSIRSYFVSSTVGPEIAKTSGQEVR
jgi:hypothetical protein